jgi:hypothetical protein
MSKKKRRRTVKKKDDSFRFYTAKHRWTLSSNGNGKDTIDCQDISRFESRHTYDQLNARFLYSEQAAESAPSQKTRRGKRRKKRMGNEAGRKTEEKVLPRNQTYIRLFPPPPALPSYIMGGQAGGNNTKLWHGKGQKSADFASGAEEYI